MKILQVGSNSVHVSSYLQALSALSHSNLLLVEEKCNFDGVTEEKIISFRSTNPFKWISAYRSLKAFLKNAQPDVIHIHQVNRLAYMVSRAAQKCAIPVLTTAWGSDVLLVPKKNAFFKFLVRKTIERSNVVTADAQDMIAAMKALVPNQQYELLQYGIDPIVSAQKERLVFSNRLHKSLYRIDQVIRYFHAFHANYPDWKLIIGGTGDQTEALKEQVQTLGLNDAVSFVGWLQKEENAQYYAKSAIYISIPESDGMSVSVLEAMSAGCIPIVPNLPVSKEWISDKVNGIIENESENPLLEALRLDQPKVAEQNAELIAERATRQASIIRFNALYQHISHGK